MAGKPKTLGELKAAGYKVLSVKEEMRANLIRKMKAGEELFPGIVGYEDTVDPSGRERDSVGPGHHLPGRARAGQDAHGSRIGQPARRGSADRQGERAQRRPLQPYQRRRQGLVEEQGDDHRDRVDRARKRYGEKLATPDITIADLIGEIDPIKVAEGRYLSDEMTIHYGLMPRTNRGIFCINELPDLAERIQVGLFNILEERDVQIRGYQMRLPLDVLTWWHRPTRRTTRTAAASSRRSRTARLADPDALSEHARPGNRHHGAGAAAVYDDRLRGGRAPVHERDRGGDQPPGPPQPEYQPALGRVGARVASPTTRASSPMP